MLYVLDHAHRIIDVLTASAFELNGDEFSCMDEEGSTVASFNRHTVLMYSRDRKILEDLVRASLVIQAGGS